MLVVSKEKACSWGKPWRNRTAMDPEQSRNFESTSSPGKGLERIQQMCIDSLTLREKETLATLFMKHPA